MYVYGEGIYRHTHTCACVCVCVCVYGHTHVVEGIVELEEFLPKPRGDFPGETRVHVVCACA